MSRTRVFIRSRFSRSSRKTYGCWRQPTLNVSESKNCCCCCCRWCCCCGFPGIDGGGGANSYLSMCFLLLLFLLLLLLLLLPPPPPPPLAECKFRSHRNSIQRPSPVISAAQVESGKYRQGSDKLKRGHAAWELLTAGLDVFILALVPGKVGRRAGWGESARKRENDHTLALEDVRSCDVLPSERIVAADLVPNSCISVVRTGTSNCAHERELSRTGIICCRSRWKGLAARSKCENLATFSSRTRHLKTTSGTLLPSAAGAPPRSDMARAGCERKATGA